jgi:hypothetical protein
MIVIGRYWRGAGGPASQEGLRHQPSGKYGSKGNGRGKQKVPKDASHRRADHQALASYTKHKSLVNVGRCNAH